MALVYRRHLAIAGAALLLMGLVIFGVGQYWPVPSQLAEESCISATPVNVTHCDQLSEQAVNATAQGEIISGVGAIVAGPGAALAVVGLLPERTATGNEQALHRPEGGRVSREVPPQSPRPPP